MKVRAEKDNPSKQRLQRSTGGIPQGLQGEAVTFSCPPACFLSPTRAVPVILALSLCPAASRGTTDSLC